MKSTQKSKEYQPSFHIVKDAYSQIREMVEGQMRGAALKLMQGFFMEEVERLCGPKFSRKEDENCHRGGSDPGSVVLQGQRVYVKKPRIKKDGEEVELKSYSALQDYDLLCERVMKHMISGVSTRDYNGLLTELEGGLGLKKSSVSKAFVMGSLQALDEINSRDLKDYDFAVIMIDAIGFANRAVTVALGITTKGRKLILGLKEGDTENSEVCKDLLQSLIERSLNKTHPILFVLDGSKALKKAVRQVFGDQCPIQRCMLHKGRNIISYLPKQYHSDFYRRWKLLHGCSDYATAKQEYAQLVHWLGKINHAALASLEEAEEETLTVIKLKLPGLLRKTTITTNPIESTFSVVNRKTGRVKNWKTGTNQISRWAAASLLDAEKRFRTIRGHKQLPLLMLELKNLGIADQQQVG
jgi:putative transposase